MAELIDFKQVFLKHYPWLIIGMLIVFLIYYVMQNGACIESHNELLKAHIELLNETALFR